MLLMYVGAVTSSTNCAIVSSTMNDTDARLPENINNRSIHDDSTTNITEKSTNDDTYACSLNETEIKQSEVSNLHVDDDNKANYY